MAKVERVEVSLENGAVASFQPDDVERIKDHKAVANEWKVGTGVHFGCNLGFMNAVAESIPELVIGKYKETAVLDGRAMAQDILNTYIEVKGLNVVKVRMAGNRSGANKKLANVKAVIEGMDPKVMEALIAAGINL